jgi:phosphatidylglycerol lysyltransferase
VVRKDGEIVAFCNLWEGGGKEELSIDLMRFGVHSPNGCMEYLFTKLMLWGAENGYASFSLGAAPLAGLDHHPLAPLWSRIGAQIYENGEHFYNFQGLRAYKDKFNPTWKPRYLATVGGMKVPHVLTDIATLIAGGWKEMLFR